MIQKNRDIHAHIKEWHNCTRLSFLFWYPSVFPPRYINTCFLSLSRLGKKLFSKTHNDWGCSGAPTQAGEVPSNFLWCLSTFENLPLNVSEQGLTFPGKQHAFVSVIKTYKTGKNVLKRHQGRTQHKNRVVTGEKQSEEKRLKLLIV